MWLVSNLPKPGCLIELETKAASVYEDHYPCCSLSQPHSHLLLKPHSQPLLLFPKLLIVSITSDLYDLWVEQYIYSAHCLHLSCTTCMWIGVDKMVPCIPWKMTFWRGGGGHGKEGYTLKHKRVLVAGLIEFMNSLVSIIGHQQTFWIVTKTPTLIQHKCIHF